LFAAIFTGGVFIFSTYHWWWLALASGILALAIILLWLWTGTAKIPEKSMKDVGLGLTLPIYVSGSVSVGWWAMFITMLGDLTAFISMVFGYFFYWTARPDFPPPAAPGLGVGWPGLALVALLSGWLLTVLSRRWNRRDAGGLFHFALTAAAALAVLGSAALVAAPWMAGLDPRRHAYDGIVWVLVVWTVVHVIVGVIMQLYCIARRLAKRMNARHDIDIVNVTLYWHFVAVTAFITVAVIAGFPLVL